MRAGQRRGRDVLMALEDRSGRVDRDKPVHVWQQVADMIREDIRAKRLRKGARLPSENELAAQYGVARLTIRRAIQDLTAEGKLTVLRGRGTFVA